MTKEHQAVKAYTLITGASAGLGKALALECAARKQNLILVALPNEGLPETSAWISQEYGVDVAHYETDLTREKCLEDLLQWVSGNFRVNFLINNAGIGCTRALDQMHPAYFDSMIKLNVRATGMMTFHLLNELKTHEKAYILNVSSIISLMPSAYKTVYSASKAFIYSFSRGLRQELRGTNVHVSVLMPGPLRTNSSVTERIKKQGFFGRMIVLEPETAAKIALAQTLDRKPVIIPGVVNKISGILMKAIPKSIGVPIISSIYSKEAETGLHHTTVHTVPGVIQVLNDEK